MKLNNILLVDAEYPGKNYPPIGLMRLSAYFKSIGTGVTFTRGKDSSLRTETFDKIFIASRFTWELKLTISTADYYQNSVSEGSDIIIGGIGITLLSNPVHNRPYTVVKGILDGTQQIKGVEIPDIQDSTPDYSLLNDDDDYHPKDSYFLKTSAGCNRTCEYCSATILEPTFKQLRDVDQQIHDVDELYGEKHHLILSDNNILGINGYEKIISKISNSGFQRGATRAGKHRHVDFNQGLDARLISKKSAAALGSINLFPVRLAFDSVKGEKVYRKAVSMLAGEGFRTYSNYMLYNHKDTAEDLYNRIVVNAELNDKLGISISAYPMCYTPISTNRKFISKRWNFQLLRGVRLLVRLSHGQISPNPEFMRHAFGSTYNEFLEILSMPERYILYRGSFSNEIMSWKTLFRMLKGTEQEDLYNLLDALSRTKNRYDLINSNKKFKRILFHYYPYGDIPR